MSGENIRYTAIDLSVDNEKGSLAEAFGQGVYTEMDSKQFAQHAYHISEVRRGHVDKVYNLITILSLFTGSEEDFVRLQGQLKIPPEIAINRADFYSQLLSYANKEEAPFGYHPFVGFCLNRVKELENATKKFKAPTVIEYLEVLRKDRLDRDENLEDQFFDRKDAYNTRGFIIPKGIIPISGKLNSNKAVFDTMNAVPKHFFYRYGVHKHSYKAYKNCVLKPEYRDYWPDAPLIRSRKTDRALFSYDTEVMPDFNEKIKALGDAFGTEIKINEMKTWEKEEAVKNGLSVLDFDTVRDHSYRILDDGETKITTIRRWRIHTSNDRTMVPRPEPEYENAKTLRCKVNDYEVFAYAVKASVARDAVNRRYSKERKKEHKKFVRELRGIISANGGRHARKLVKIYEGFFTDMAGYVAARNAMYAYNFDENQDLTNPNIKSINLSLDQGLEFAFGNKLSAFHDLKARWVLPCIQYMANEMTYDFYKKMNVSPRQIAEGMARVGVKCGTIRDVPAEKATKDDYALVLYDSINEYGRLDTNYDIDKNKPELRKIKIKDQDIKKEQSFEEARVSDFDVKDFERGLTANSTPGNIEDLFGPKEESKPNAETVVSEMAAQPSNVNENPENVITDEISPKVAEDGVKIFENVSKLKEEKVGEIEEASTRRQEIANEIVSQSTKEPEIVPNETFVGVIARIDEKDAIDIAVESGQPVENPSQYIDESTTENNIIVETISGADDENSIIYVDDKGNPHYSRTAMLSNIKPVNESSDVIEDDEELLYDVAGLVTENGFAEKDNADIVTILKRHNGEIQHIDTKIRKALFKRFNSNFQKEKIRLEKTLSKKLASYEGKKISNNTQQKLDILSKKIDFYEGLIMSNIESIPELAKMNSFSGSKTMSDDQLADRAESKDPAERKYGIIQKEMVNVANKLIVGIGQMVKNNPEKYAGKSVTQLISDFRQQEMLNEKDYINEVVMDVVTRLDEFESLQETENNKNVNEGDRTNDR